MEELKISEDIQNSKNETIFTLKAKREEGGLVIYARSPQFEAYMKANQSMRATSYTLSGYYPLDSDHPILKYAPYISDTSLTDGTFPNLNFIYMQGLGKGIRYVIQRPVPLNEIKKYLNKVKERIQSIYFTLISPPKVDYLYKNPNIEIRLYTANDKIALWAKSPLLGSLGNEYNHMNIIEEYGKPRFKYPCPPLRYLLNVKLYSVGRLNISTPNSYINMEILMDARIGQGVTYYYDKISVEDINYYDKNIPIMIKSLVDEAKNLRSQHYQIIDKEGEPILTARFYYSLKRNDVLFSFQSKRIEEYIRNLPKMADPKVLDRYHYFYNPCDLQTVGKRVTYWNSGEYDIIYEMGKHRLYDINLSFIRRVGLADGIIEHQPMIADSDRFFNKYVPKILKALRDFCRAYIDKNASILPIGSMVPDVIQ